ncbi:hypothetical protein PUN28_006436 [Cardiocondyla obscurior]|uniref:Uncharacterized protein n=1 Tax=Cardiocondyla obscurior TaxID=286306 RepID=A0AAW2GAD9_9HYME
MPRRPPHTAISCSRFGRALDTGRSLLNHHPRTCIRSVSPSILCSSSVIRKKREREASVLCHIIFVIVLGQWKLQRPFFELHMSYVYIHCVLHLCRCSQHTSR